MVLSLSEVLARIRTFVATSSAVCASCAVVWGREAGKWTALTARGCVRVGRRVRENG